MSSIVIVRLAQGMTMCWKHPGCCTPCRTSKQSGAYRHEQDMQQGWSAEVKGSFGFLKQDGFCCPAVATVGLSCCKAEWGSTLCRLDAL